MPIKPKLCKSKTPSIIKNINQTKKNNVKKAGIWDNFKLSKKKRKKRKEAEVDIAISNIDTNKKEYEFTGGFGSMIQHLKS